MRSYSNFNTHSKPFGSHTGFSLIELLVVIAIVGIMIALVSLAVGRGLSDTTFKTESRKLKSLAQMASEEAILFNQSLGIRFEEAKYAFYKLEEVPKKNPNQVTQSVNPFLPSSGQVQNQEPETELLWLPIEKDQYFTARSLPEDHVFDVLLDGISIELNEENFKGSTFNQEEEQEPIKPHIFITPDGEVFPNFEVRILHDDIDESWGVVTLDEEGELSSYVYEEDS